MNDSEAGANKDHQQLIRVQGSNSHYAPWFLLVFVSTSIHFCFKISFDLVLLAGVLFVLSGLMGFAGVHLIMTQFKIILSLILHFAIIGIFLYWADLLSIIDIILAVVWYVSAMGLSLSSKKSRDLKKKIQ